jgi:general stress protein 26
MSEMTLPEISEKMRKIDFAVLFTTGKNGYPAGRPMSNNGDVEYEGDNWFFTDEKTNMVSDIERDPKVALSFRGDTGLLGKPPIFIAIEADAELIRDKAAFEEHWAKGLDRWFEQGVDIAPPDSTWPASRCTGQRTWANRWSGWWWVRISPAIAGPRMAGSRRWSWVARCRTASGPTASSIVCVSLAGD